MAVRFDAATDRINYTGSDLPDPEAGITITAWVYVSVDRDDFSTFARLSAAGGTAALFASAADGTGGPIYGTGGGTLTAVAGMTVGAWYRLAATCTGTSGILYTADAAGATAVQSGTVDGASTPDQLCLGGRASADATEWLNGRMASVRLWSTVLSQAQIEAEWASRTPAITANLVADWPLATASDLTDHSGNGRHLTAGSTAVTTEDGPPIAQSAALLTAAETDTALTLGRAKTRALGVAAATDTALPLGRAKTRALGAAAETDTALALAASGGAQLAWPPTAGSVTLTELATATSVTLT